MSRNARQHPPRTPVKASKRRDRGRDSDSCTSPDLSDDSGYSGVEDISDSDEDDEDHVYAAEEEHMIKQAVRNVAPVPPRPQEDVGDEADEEDEEDEEDDDDDDDDDDDVDEDQEDPKPEGFAGVFIDSSPTWDGFASDELIPDMQANDAPQDVVVERHVRFAGVPDSDSDSTTSDLSDDANQFFPDIFVEQSSLDPAFRREVERDDEDSDHSGTFWDFHNSQDPWAESDNEALVQGGGFDQDFTPHATPVASAAVTAVSSLGSPADVQELGGYETDGDTTEEEVPEPIPRKKRIRRSPPVPVSSGSETEKAVIGRRDRPRVGHFTLDDSERKPIAVINPLTRKMMIFTPQKRRQFDLAPESFNFDFVNHPSFTQSSPILANPSSLMMSAMFSSNTFGDFLNSQPIGPAEAFFPCASDPVHAVETDSDLVDEYYQDEEEDSLRLDDFIVGFGDSDSEASGDDRDESTSSPVKEPKDGSAQDDRATPSRPRAISSASARSDTSGMHPLLSHFGNNSDAVGAFRRHQINQQLISSAKASQESLAFSGPLTYGTLRGIKNGSMSTVTSPLTPARKRKVKNGASVREENTLSWDTGSILDSPSCVMARKREGADDEELFLADGRVAKRIRHDTSDQFDMI